MTQQSNSQDWNVNENCLVPLSLALKDQLRRVFETRYKLSKRVTWLPFEQDWARELDSLLPTRPTIRDVVFKAHRQIFEYRVANGLCKLLLNCSYQECIEKYKESSPQHSCNSPDTLLLRAGSKGEYIETSNSPNVITLADFGHQLLAGTILLNDDQNTLSVLGEMGMRRAYAGEYKTTMGLTNLYIVLCPISVIPTIGQKERYFSRCE